MEAWTHNLRLLYRLIAPARSTDEPLRISEDRKWVGLLFLPVGLTEFEALAHRDLQSAEIIGGWPLIAAFNTTEDYILAKLRFS